MCANGAGRLQMFVCNEQHSCFVVDISYAVCSVGWCSESGR